MPELPRINPVKGVPRGRPLPLSTAYMSRTNRSVKISISSSLVGLRVLYYERFGTLSQCEWVTSDLPQSFCHLPS